MIDNYDSFTYNVVQYCLELGANLKVIRNDELSLQEIIQLAPKKIIISPGPATPDDAGITLEVINYFKDKLPIFGICLGHQSIAQVYGAKIVRARHMMHGKTSIIQRLEPSKIFTKIPEQFRATRYHSLIVDKNSLPKVLEISATSMDDHEIMAIHVKNRPIYGVQFHPESIMSEFGKEIIGNFINI